MKTLGGMEVERDFRTVCDGRATYGRDDVQHTYACTRCDWTRAYPIASETHGRQAEEAVTWHYKKCHRAQAAFEPPTTVSDEHDLMEAISGALDDAIAAKVHPGDTVAVMAMSYCGIAGGLGLSLEQALEVVRSWWPGGKVDQAARTSKESPKS